MGKQFRNLDEIAAALDEMGGRMAIADELAIPRPSLSQFLNARQRLAEEHLVKLAEKLGCPAKVLEQLQPGAIRRGLYSAVRMSEGPSASPPPVRGDFEFATRWLVTQLDEQQLREQINTAVNTGQSGVARILLDLLDERTKNKGSA